MEFTKSGDDVAALEVLRIIQVHIARLLLGKEILLLLHHIDLAVKNRSQVNQNSKTPNRMSSKLFKPAPEPVTPLARHRILSPTAAIRVSPLCLGAMNFGDAWKEFMGECNKQTAFEMLDFFYESGGNFVDTANNYQSEESEMWIGEWMEKRGVRDQMVIATKFTTDYTKHNAQAGSLQSNFTGNSNKSLHLSLEASLKKLKTSYVDLVSTAILIVYFDQRGLGC